MYQEFNFDGLVGPTHNYAGLARGNLASAAHRHHVAHPRRAALQGIAKMRALSALGIPQAVLPPHERPSVEALRAFGFEGCDEGATLARAAREAPDLLAACASGSSMWTANAATVTPSCDSGDGRLHLSVANLGSHLHRALEAPETDRILRRIFAQERHFAVHPPLPGGHAMRDEGAANHTRLAPGGADSGLHLFVYGARTNDACPPPGRFSARQTLEASQAVARRHGIAPERALFLRQAPRAIDAGVFHNDVIAVGHRHVFLHHEAAFAEGAAAGLEERYETLFGVPLVRIEVPEARVSLALAVRSYLFNSQVVTLPGGGELLVCPKECAEAPEVAALLDEIVADPRNSIGAVRMFDLRESMHNGGGPACLRLRVLMSEAERAAVQPRVFATEDGLLYDELERWVETHYRESLAPADLADPALLRESRTALDALTGILRLGSVYPFQRDPTA